MERMVSANELYHFTKKEDNLKSILQHGFYPRCCIEDFTFLFSKLPELKIGYCMVCFCDLPEFLQDQHKSEYGEYGIALRKEWGLRNGICPVLYVPDSDRKGSAIDAVRYMASQVRGMLEYTKGKGHVTSRKESDAMKIFYSSTEELFGSLNQFFGYLKRYQETLNDRTVKRYYDEREWRYLVPWVDDESRRMGITNTLIGKDASNEKMRIGLNKRMEQRPLRFDVEDIVRIVVPTKEAKDSMRGFIMGTDLLGVDNLHLSLNQALDGDVRETLASKIL